MKAIVITEPGSPDVLKVEDRPIPLIQAGEVLIKVMASGVNRPDALQRQGKYPAPPGAPPDIPGLEVAGIIESINETTSSWLVGDQVCALVSGGGYAQYVVAHEAHCLPIPNGHTYIEAAGLPETTYTVIHNVFQLGALSIGESLLIHGGSSGIGTTAIQLAKAWGAQVFATAGTDEKCQACLDLGADRCINYREADFAEILGANSVDVVLDMVGGSYFEKHLRLLKPDGRMVSINAMEGRQGRLDILAMMVKRLNITGSTLRSRSHEFKAKLTKDVHTMVWPLIAEGKFSPVIYKTFPLVDAHAAHTLMESSAHIGKIVLTTA